jgi:hypothetical protein
MSALTLIALTVVGAELPTGSAPRPLAADHFPSRLHAYVWRNWQLVSAERLAEVVGAEPQQVRALGARLGLPPQAPISEDLRKRSYITVIRRNWHLLPYDQLLTLLGWSAEELAYILREDDFLYIKLGSLKPACEPLRWHEPDAAERQREDAIRAVVAREFPEGLLAGGRPLFGFVDDLCAPLPPAAAAGAAAAVSHFATRFGYSYFATYGDPLLDASLDPYPDAYLERLSRAGVNGVWLPVVLYKMAPFPWDAALSAGWETRLANLGALAARTRRHGVRLFLYLNEPRAMPLAFFAHHPELRGVTEGDHATLCTSVASVREYLTDASARVCAAAPQLGGVFTISASENLTNCWSHGQGTACPRCGPRGAAAVIAEANGAIEAGVHRANAEAQMIAWDWGWPDDQVPAIIERLPRSTALMSVSEWSLPITRGGIASVVGEYSISSVGPGPRALKHWALARARGLRTFAKVQAGTTWELGSVPYIPATALVAEHLCALAKGVGDPPVAADGLMLGWTLGGYPSPNLELAGIIDAMPQPDADAALAELARRRFGAAHVGAVLAAWRIMSDGFRQFPYHPGLLYDGPQHMGPANLLYPQPTGYRATMVGFPYDDLKSWRAIYPPQVFVAQFERAAAGFREGARRLAAAAADAAEPANAALTSEAVVAEATAICFQSCADQARYVLARDQGAPDAMASAARAEESAARRLYALQLADPRLGFEASNHYFYTPLDLAEKVVQCEWLLSR